jgi:hypothetical protein
MEQPSVTQVYREARPDQPTRPNRAPPAPLAHMPGRGPRIGENVVVFTKIQDLVKDHPQLKGRVSGFFPAGFVGKWIQGKVKHSVARTVSSQTIWAVHYCGFDVTYEMKRARLETAVPAVHESAIFTGVSTGAPVATVAAPTPDAAQQAAQPPAPAPGPSPAAAAPTKDMVQAGDVSWEFLPVGATPDCRPSLDQGVDRRREFLGSETVRLAPALSSLIKQIKETHPTSRKA